MINTSESRIIFNGNGTATEFPYSFDIINDTDVKVMTVDPDGVETVLDSDYYVDVTASKVIYPGYPPGEEPVGSERPPVLPTGWQLVVYRDIPITQEANLGNVWPFNVIEDALDKITMILQTSRDTSDRSLKVSESAPSDVDIVVPIAANMALKWDAQGKKIVLTTDPAEVLPQAQNLLQQTTQQANIATEQAGIATDKANAAAESAVSAATSETNAANSEDKAQAWAESETSPDGEPDSKSAKTWAEEAISSAASAAESESNAAASAIAAAGSASAAAQSQTNAAQSATSASQSASAANSSQTAAANSASAALTSENNAAESEQNAAGSASAAANSASAASQSATAAAQSAEEAISSAASAAESESNAAASAIAAAGSASAAAQSQTNAAQSATSASQSASAANSSQTAAANSASAALTSENNAAESEQNAAGSASAAANSASAASQSATAAAQSAEEAAQTAAGLGTPVTDVTESNGTITVEKSDGTNNSFDIPQPTIATQAEAEAGTNNTKFMTPLRVAQAIPFTALATTIGGASATKPAVIVETKISGNNWYRRWSDGWVEQGGYYTKQTANIKESVTFLVPMANTKYYTNTIRSYIGDAGAFMVLKEDKYTTKIDVAYYSTYNGDMNSGIKGTSFYWEVKGQGA